MISVVSLLIVVLCSMIVVKVGTVALTMTGLDVDIAHMQALSSFSGVGFTTLESESVVSQPVRRKIIKFLIMAGNAGISSAVATLVVSLVRTEQETDLWRKIGAIVAGLLVLYFIAQSRWLGRILSRIIKNMLARLTTLELHDYETLLNLSSGYGITEVLIKEGSPIIAKSLRELDLPKRKILVIGVHRGDGRFEGTPHGDCQLAAGDRAICYGNNDKVRQWADEIQRAAGES